MARRIYVASSWRNGYQPWVVDRLRKAGHEVYDFRNPAPGDDGFRWSEIDQEWESWDPAEYREALEHPIAIRGFDNDKGGMDWADTCVLVLPSGRSAHTEAGYMAGQGKRVIVFIPERCEPELMYKLLGPICLGFDELGVVLNWCRLCGGSRRYWNHLLQEWRPCIDCVASDG